MKLSKLSHRRVTAALALASVAAVGLPTREAHAYAWWCDVVDGHDASGYNIGATYTGDALNNPGGAVFFDGSAWPVYGMWEPTPGGNFIKSGANYFLGSSTPWNLSNVDGPGIGNHTSMQLPSAVVYDNQIWTAYVDGWGGVYAGGSGSHIGPVAGTPLSFNPTYNCAHAVGQPVLAIDGVSNNLFVIYAIRVDNLFDCSTAHQEIHFSVTNGTSWLVQDEVLAGGTNTFFNSPTAVAWGHAGLDVFFVDQTAGALKESVSTNRGGTSKSPITLDPHVNQFGSGGGFPAVVVDAGGAMHTLYSRPTSAGWVQLVDAMQTTQGGAPAILPVDGMALGDGMVNGKMSFGSPPAVVQWTSAQAYYLDSNVNTLRSAYYNESTHQWNATLMDGGPGTTNLCSCTVSNGACTPKQEPANAPSGFDSMPVSHALGAVLGATVHPTNGPHVFYNDVTTGDLREMFQQ